MEQVSQKLLNWASDVEQDTLQQALKTSRLPFIEGHVALMPDAHVGIGATVGSVIPTSGAIIPAAVGVDIGCGMIAVETNLNASDLPDNIELLIPDFEQVVPAGVGKGHSATTKDGSLWFSRYKDSFASDLTNKQAETITSQFGSLGSGNHFLEVCLDESDTVWIVLHSGSRGIGNQLARVHMDKAKKLMREMFIKLEDPDLAYFVQDTPEFTAYIADMNACQAFALGNRDTMMNNALKVFFLWVGHGEELNRVNCHHNFTQMENHRGKNLWITRKGAIKAATGDFGVIPGSMGTRSYIVKGLGNSASYNSCSHGAGRRYSRSKAKTIFTVEELAEQMSGKAWQSDKAASLLDEIPSAYKDIDQVMDDQKDLVSIEHTLHQILNYKGC
jgi:tRNA-splicing ligase RtcB